MSKRKKSIDKLKSEEELMKTRLVSFDTWFFNQVKLGKLKDYQKLEIFTFIVKDHKLKEVEDPNSYDRILRLY